MRSRAVLGTEAAGLGDEALFHPVLDQGGRNWEIREVLFGVGTSVWI